MKKLLPILIVVSLLIITGSSGQSLTRIISDAQDTIETYIRNSNGNYWEVNISNIQNAIDDLSSSNGGYVDIPCGVYSGSDDQILLSVSNTTIQARGNIIFDNVTIRIEDASNVVIDGINFTGNPSHPSISIRGGGKNFKILRCSSYNLGVAYVCSFEIYPRNLETIENVLYQDCEVTGGGRHGFQLNALHTGGARVNNITYERCKAIRCGVSERFNDWIVGFLIEKPYANHIKYIDCVANYNWESGFHLESTDEYNTIQFINCEANYNGQDADAGFGSGFFISNACNVTCLNCEASFNHGSGTNSGNGFRLNYANNTIISNCRVCNNTGRAINVLSHSNNVIVESNIGINNNASDIMISSSCPNCIVSKNQLRDCATTSIKSEGNNAKIVENNVESPDSHGIQVSGDYSTIENNYLNDTTHHSIVVSSAYVIIAHNHIYNSSQQSINLAASSSYCSVDHNIVDANIGDDGSNNIRFKNIGFITENYGTCTVSNGNTWVLVTHGLDVTPGFVMATANESLGSASFFYVHSYTSTQFNLTVNTDPTQDVDFKWWARLEP